MASSSRCPPTGLCRGTPAEHGCCHPCPAHDNIIYSRALLCQLSLEASQPVWLVITQRLQRLNHNGGQQSRMSCRYIKWSSKSSCAKPKCRKYGSCSGGEASCCQLGWAKDAYLAPGGHALLVLLAQLHLALLLCALLHVARHLLRQRRAHLRLLLRQTLRAQLPPDLRTRPLLSQSCKLPS